MDVLLDHIKNDFAVFETVIFPGSSNTVANFNETFSIPTAGVFSTYFLFGKHKPASELDFNNDEADDNEADDSRRNNRALLPTHAFDTTKPHLLIKG